MVGRKAQKAGSKQPATLSTSQVSADRPDVIVEFLFDRGLLHISINNIGNKPALNVSVEFDKKILGFNGKEISALAVFRNIEFLGPRREILALLDTSSSYFKREQPTKISALVTYRDLEERNYQVTIKHDLEIYRELSFIAHGSSDNKGS
jgi:hypothetical protein